jgi:Cu/Zn superoxide dismutase
MNQKICVAAMLLTSSASAFAATGTRATATLSDSAGKVVGTAKISAKGSGLIVTVKAKGMAQWNPTTKQHGRDNPMGAHEGDLPNLTIGATGKGRLTFEVPAATLSGENGLLDEDGAALVIHAKPDDYRTDPSGNSGDRTACGVLAAK